MEFTEKEKSVFEQVAEALSEQGAYLSSTQILDILQAFEIAYSIKEFTRSEGASKYVVVFKNRNYVLKWSGDNSVLKEAVIYNKAVEKNLGFLFPQTILLGEYNDIYYSIQEKVDYCARRIPEKDRTKYLKMTKTVSYNIYKKMENGFQIDNCGYCRDLHEMWAKVFLSIYGKAVAKRLCSFIQENRINDLHSSNIGFLNRRPILLDFCGYENDTEE